MTKEKYNLISRSKEELIALIEELMNKLPEKERIEFVSKWISPKEALMEAANKAIEVWINFGQMSSEGILDCFKDNS